MENTDKYIHTEEGKKIIEDLGLSDTDKELLEHITNEEMNNDDYEEFDYYTALEGIMDEFYNKVNTYIHTTIGNNADTIELTEEQINKVKLEMIHLLDGYSFVFTPEVRNDMIEHINNSTNIFQ